MFSDLSEATNNLPCSLPESADRISTSICRKSLSPSNTKSILIGSDEKVSCYRFAIPLWERLANVPTSKVR